MPVTFNVPVTFAPVPVITKMFALPSLLILTFPLLDGMFTLLLPFARVELVLILDQVNTPEPFVCRY